MILSHVASWLMCVDGNLPGTLASPSETGAAWGQPVLALLSLSENAALRANIQLHSPVVAAMGCASMHSSITALGCTFAFCLVGCYSPSLSTEHVSVSFVGHVRNRDILLTFPYCGRILFHFWRVKLFLVDYPGVTIFCC